MDSVYAEKRWDRRGRRIDGCGFQQAPRRVDGRGRAGRVGGREGGRDGGGSGEKGRGTGEAKREGN